MSAFRAFFDRIRGVPQDLRVLMIGLDASGKTTILYKLKLGEIVTTIPTIGFNVEDITVKNYRLTFWDVGGCGTAFRALIRHYHQNTKIVFHVIDVNDTERLSESIEELHYQLDGILEENPDLEFLAVLLNKQDLPSVTPESIEKTRGIVGDILAAKSSRFQYGVYDTSAVMDDGSNGLWEVVNDVVERIDAARQNRTIEDKYKKIGEEKRKELDRVPTVEELRARIGSERYSDLEIEPEELLARMRSGRLEAWDHRTHLRVAYTILCNHLSDWHGGNGQSAVIDASEEFLSHLEAMLRSSTPGKFRNTVHRTMTTFWMHEIARAMVNTDDYVPTTEAAKLDPLRNFLWRNPMLMFGGLWKEYYTPKLLFSPEAKEGWRLPDLKPLQPLLPTGTGAELSGKKLAISSDDYAPDPVSSDRYKRFAYALLQRIRATKERRGGVIAQMLPELQRQIIVSRQTNADQQPYSETQFYFWMQVVHAAVSSRTELDVTKMNYNTLLLFFPDVLGDDNLWKKFYSEDVWKSVDARMYFRGPSKGKAAIPNVWPVQEGRDGRENWRVMFDVGYPSQVELANRARWMGEFGENLQHREAKSRTPPPVYNKKEEEDDWVDLKDDVAKKTSSLSITEKTPSSINKAEVENEPTDNSWLPHARLIHAIFTRLVSSSGSRRSLTDAAYSDFETSERSMTAKMFWTKLILSAFVRMYPPSDDEKEELEEKKEDKMPKFKEFLEKNPELAWDGLYRVYYSEAVWRSENVRERFVSGDLRDLPAYL